MASFLSCFILLVFCITVVQGRILSLYTSSNGDLISDGVDRGGEYHPSLVAATVPPPPSTCDHMYGFLPCVENFWGYIFMLLVFQGLLIHGELMIGSGCGVLASILGAVENLNTAKVGGVILNILMALPSMLVMIVSGVFSSEEGAANLVSAGVGIYAGITVFILTVQWAVCVMCGQKDIQRTSSNIGKPAYSKRFSTKRALDFLKDNAVITIDENTQYTGGILLLSLIPYVILQLHTVFKASSEIVTLTALIVSFLFLIAYFIYQIWDPWAIQQGHLDYLKYELRTEFLHHLRRHGEFVDHRGELNTDIIKKLYADVGKDSDTVTEVEVKRLVNDILITGKVKVSERFAVDEIMKTFDFDSDKKITEDEFIEGCKSWIGDTKLQAGNIGDSTSNIVQEILNLFKDNRLKDHQERARIMSKVLKHAEKHILKTEKLVTPEGEPNVEQIKKLFRKYDTDGNNWISTSELEQLLKNVNFGETQITYENVVKDLFKEFDTDHNNAIDESEFIAGVKLWIRRAIGASNTPDKTKCIGKYHDIMWKQRMYGKWDVLKSVIKILFGIAIMTCLGGPFMVSILQLSYALSLPSFCISFVIVPTFTCGIATVRAIMPVKEQASLTFSEIYSRVIMNNLMGVTTLLSIVYAKGLAFDFTAEVLTILVVCAIIGALAFSRKTYPGWTSILAIILYPSSLAMFYMVEIVWSWN